MPIDLSLIPNKEEATGVDLSGIPDFVKPEVEPEVNLSMIPDFKNNNEEVIRESFPDPKPELKSIGQAYSDSEFTGLPTDLTYGNWSHIEAHGASGTWADDTWWQTLKKATQRVPENVKLAIAGISRAAEENPSAEAIEKLDNELFKSADPELNAKMKEWAYRKTIDHRKLSFDAQERLAKLQAQVQPGSFKYYVGLATESVLTNLAYILPSLATKDPRFALSAMGIQTAGQEFIVQREAGSDPTVASLASLGYGVSEVLTEFIPVGVLLKPSKSFATKIIKTMFAEIPTEAVNEVAQVVIDKVTVEPETSLHDALNRIHETIIVTTIASPVLGGISQIITGKEGEAPEVPEVPKPDTADIQSDIDLVDEESQVDLEVDTELGVITPEGQPITPEAEEVQFQQETQQAIIDESELKGEVALEPEITDEQTSEEVQAIIEEEEDIEGFIQDLGTVRDVIAFDPQVEFNLFGATRGVTDIEVVRSLNKAEKNKKLTPRQARINAGINQRAHDELSNALATNPDINQEDFIDNAVKRIKDEFSSRIEQRRTAKQIIRKETGQVRKEAKTVTESMALRETFRKSAQAARIAFREGNREGVAKEKARMTEIVNKMRLKRRQEVEATKLRTQLKKIDKQKSRNIALDYQKKIKELTEDIDIAKPSAKTLKKLNSLKAYIEKNGEPLGISTKHIQALDRLEKIPIADMSPTDIKELRDEIKTLQQLGKLKKKLEVKYKKEKQKSEIQELVDSTTNIDPERNLTKTGELTRATQIKAGALTAYIETLHTPRVTETLDGFTPGKNTELMRKFADAEINWQTTSDQVRVNAIEEVSEKTGITEMTEEQEARIMVNIRLQENAFDQANVLMDKYSEQFGWGEQIPVLQENEQQVINILKKHTNQFSHEIAALWEEKEGEIFPFLDNYILPIYYEKEFHFSGVQDIEQTYRRRVQTFQGFIRERQPGVKKVPRIDLWGVFDEAIDAQQYFLNIQPVIENTKPLVLSDEYRDQAGDYAYSFWKDHLDIMARRGWGAGATSSPFSRALRFFRVNLNQAVLGYKFSTIVMQPFAVFDAIAYTTSRWGVTTSAEIAKQFTKAWVVPGHAKKIIDQSEVLKHRLGGEIAIEETLKKLSGKKATAREKFIAGGMNLIRIADLKTAAGVQEGVKKILESQGVENAQKEAEFIMNLTQGSAKISYRPHVLARGEFARTWFTFQTFFLNRWGLIAHDIIAKGVKGDWKGRLNATMALIILMGAGMLEDEAREIIYEGTTGKELPDEDDVKRTVLWLPRQLPAVGQFFEPGLSSLPPTLRTAEKAATGLVSIFSEDPQHRAKGFVNAAEAGMSLYYGIPGTAQAFDLLEAQLQEKPKGRK